MLARKRRAPAGAVALLFWLAAPVGHVPAQDGPGPAREAGDTAIPQSAFAFLTPLRGESGALRVVFRTPGSALTSREPGVGFSLLFGRESSDALASDRVPPEPGVYDIVLKAGETGRKAEDLRVVTLVPFSEKRQGRVGRYLLGSEHADFFVRCDGDVHGSP